MASITSVYEGEDASDILNDILCEPCSMEGRNIEADNFCVDCKEKMCTKCTSNHKMFKTSRKHTTMTIMEMKRNNPKAIRRDKCTERCGGHDEKMVKYVCNSHSVFVCSICANTIHKKCNNVVYIPTVAEDIENDEDFKKFNDTLKSMEKALKDQVSEIVKAVKYVEKGNVDFKETIKNFREKMNNALDEFERKTTTKFESSKKENIHKLNLISSNFNDNLQEIEDLHDKVEKQISAGQRSNTYILMKKESKKLDSLKEELVKITKETSVEHCVFRPCFDAIKEDALGRLEIRTENVAIAASVTKLVPIIPGTDTTMPISEASKESVAIASSGTSLTQSKPQTDTKKASSEAQKCKSKKISYSKG